MTTAGEALIEIAGPFLRQWEELPGRLQEVLGGPMRGPVRVGAGEAPVLYLLPGPISVFRKHHPKVEVVVMNQPAEETLSLLRNGTLDFGLRSVQSCPPDLSYRPSLFFDRVLIAPRGHPISKLGRVTLKALSQYPLVMPRKNSVTRRLVEEAFEKEGLRCQVALEAGGWEIIKRYASLGHGIAIAPEICVEPVDRKSLVIRPVRHLFGRDAYGIVVRKGRHLSRAAQTLIRRIDPTFPIEKD